MTIGYDREEDEKYFYVSPTGVVVVTKDSVKKRNSQKSNSFNNFDISEDKFNKSFMLQAVMN